AKSVPAQLGEPKLPQYTNLCKGCDFVVCSRVCAIAQRLLEGLFSGVAGSSTALDVERGAIEAAHQSLAPQRFACPVREKRSMPNVTRARAGLPMRKLPSYSHFMTLSGDQ